MFENEPQGTRVRSLEDPSPLTDATAIVGEITEAYLHRDVHPDEKAGHVKKPLNVEPIFPKGEDLEKKEDLWMYM